LMEDQNVPRLVATSSCIASRNMHAIEPLNISPQDINSQYPQALDASLELLEAPLLSVTLAPLKPTADADSYTNLPNATPAVQNIIWSSNPGVTSRHENSSSSTAQLMPALHTGSVFASVSEDRSDNTKETNLGHPKLQRHRSILPAPEKSYLRKRHASIGLANLQPVHAHQETQPRRSDKRKLTEQEKDNAREVRQKGGSCLPCVWKKCKVIEFYVQAATTLLMD
jgi:hypothetical protein